MLQEPSRLAAVCIGASLRLLSHLVGPMGGIFLTRLLLLSCNGDAPSRGGWFDLQGLHDSHRFTFGVRPI